MKVGFIGTGHIAAPMARHVAAKGHEVLVTERNATISAQLRDQIGAGVADAQGVIDGSDRIILCLRPHIATEVLGPLSFRAEHSVISVMAGISRAELGQICGPVSRFAQTIPLGFLEGGGCPLAVFGEAALVADLFAPENPVIDIADEAHLNAHFAICALVPGLLDMMAQGSAWLASQTGAPDKAEFFTAQLVSGFLSALDRKSPGVLAQERDALATDGTLSLMMVQALRDGGAGDALDGALKAIAQRLEGAT